MDEQCKDLPYICGRILGVMSYADEKAYELQKTAQVISPTLMADAFRAPFRIIALKMGQIHKRINCLSKQEQEKIDELLMRLLEHVDADDVKHKFGFEKQSQCAVGYHHQLYELRQGHNEE